MIEISILTVIIAFRLLIWYAQCSREFWLVIICKDITLKAIRDILLITAIYGGVFFW